MSHDQDTWTMYLTADFKWSRYPAVAMGIRTDTAASSRYRPSAHICITSSISHKSSQLKPIYTKGTLISTRKSRVGLSLHHLVTSVLASPNTLSPSRQGQTLIYERLALQLVRFYICPASSHPHPIQTAYFCFASAQTE